MELSYGEAIKRKRMTVDFRPEPEMSSGAFEAVFDVQAGYVSRRIESPRVLARVTREPFSRATRTNVRDD